MSDHTTKNFIIYRSSAGSGKTYTLTREYLKLALKQPHYYRHILAVTFTNKAMQEMKNRIIQKLDEFSKGTFDGMAFELMEVHNYDEKVFRDRSSDLLSRILHGYSHFAVSTIDSFFQTVIRSFSRELGLAGSYRLELDYELILIQIVNDLLLDVEENRHLRNWLISFTLDKLGEGKNWDVQKELRSFAKELFREEVQGLEEDVLNKNAEDVTQFLEAINTYQRIFENKMRQSAQEAIDILNTYNLSADDFTQKGRGVAAYPSRIIAGNYAPNNYVRQALEQDKWYPAKSLRATDIDSALNSGFRSAIQEAYELWEQENKKYATAKLIWKFIYGYGLLSDLARKLRAYKSENDVMLISDATQFLRELIRDTDAPFVYEKVGSFFNHYLIDEFQDTSIFQWDSFMPLIENSLSEGNNNYLVGDVKQSIYRWRGGDLELLQEKASEQVGRSVTEIRQLTTNYRSEAKVIKFNNLVFEHLPKTVKAAYSEKSSYQEQKVLDSFQHVYADASQEVSQAKKEDNSGYVRVTFFEDEDDYRWMQKVNEQIPSLVEELQDKGVPARKIAILVRENKEGQAIADMLMAYASSSSSKAGYNYEVVSNEALFLTGSPVISTLIGALRYLQEPRNGINRAELAYNFLTKSGRSPLDNHSIFSEVNDDEKFRSFMPDGFYANRDFLMKMPFYELIDKLINDFELDVVKGQFAYLQTFQDQVLSFVQQEKADINSFLLWWDEKGHRQSIKVADDLDAMRILTIHKSKGLEYHTVIVPYCNWHIDHKMRPILWNKIEEEPFNIGALPIEYSSSMENTYFEEEYANEKAKAYMDSLNMLYVTFTRAAENLIVYSTPKENRKKGIGELLYQLVSNEAFELSSNWDINSNSLRYGELNTYISSEESKVEALNLNTYNNFHWRGKITIRPSTYLKEQTDDRYAKMSYGNLVHRVLARVRYMEDFKTALDTIYFEESLNHSEADELKGHLKQLFNSDKVKGWFSKKWKVKNESTLLSLGSELRPDRVIWNESECIVIDYKTGVKSNGHMKQVTEYVELLSQIMTVSVTGYVWYLNGSEVVPC